MKEFMKDLFNSLMQEKWSIKKSKEIVQELYNSGYEYSTILDMIRVYNSQGYFPEEISSIVSKFIDAENNLIDAFELKIK